FRSSDLGAPAFGWNLPNWLTRKLLTEALAARPDTDLRLGTGFRSVLTREREAIVTLSDGDRLRARLAIAADGRASPLRDALGIKTTIARYGQKALAFTVTHDAPHNNVSTELYLSGGAFTLVPLPDHHGQPASAVVWMNDGPDALRLLDMGTTAFSQAATTRSCGVLGNLTLASPRRMWPVVTQRAMRLTAERSAIIAEAAHVLPPIGAQGLNTSLHDVSALVDLARDTPEEIGERGWLDRFARRRERDIRARAGVIDLYNRVCRSDAPPVQALRSLGLSTVHDVAPLRKGIMRAGLGGRG
ncbi:MAG: UbiH/UbiF family hydroxylase, partial [Silicimonas sp.]|nr:UbiH/UbiF family hydroxylase [Silicimonas sp.]